MEPYYVSVMLLTIEGDRRAIFPDVDCQHVNVRSEDVLRVCSFLIRAMRGRLAELTVSVWRGDHAEQLWQWRTLRPTPAQRKHLAELDRNRARRAAARCAECEATADDLKPIAAGSDLFCTDCRLRLNPEHR